MPRLGLLLCKLLMSCLCFSASGAVFVVSQTPSTITMEECTDVQIFCCLNISTDALKVKWIKDNREIQIRPYHANKTQNQTCFNLSITITQKNDSGFYLCEVTKDIPTLIKINGSGTNVTCKETNASADAVTADTAGFSVPVLGSSVSVAVLIITAVCLTVWRVSKCCRQRERVVIKEGPPSEQEDPENSEGDGQSLETSRGSTQWYMVPVYDSYFDLQRSDEPQFSESTNTGSTNNHKSQDCS